MLLDVPIKECNVDGHNYKRSGCLPQSTSFKGIELDFLTYFRVVMKPRSFVQESEVAMQLDVAFVIHRGLLATSLFVEGRSLVSSFDNVIGVVPLLQASEFYCVRLMRALPKLLFVVVILISSILFFITLLMPLPCGFSTV